MTSAVDASADFLWASVEVLATPKKLSPEHIPGFASQERKPQLVGALT